MSDQTLFIPVADTPEFGKVLMTRYASERLPECKWAIMDVARRQGFTGTCEERLAQLGWVIKEFSLEELIKPC